MSETAIQSKAASHGNTADQQVLAQVEKWLAVIREVVSERSAPSKFPR
jgi:hypothetical protein